MTSFFYVVSYCHLSATLQTMSIIVETYRQSSCGSNFYGTFKVFIQLSLVYKIQSFINRSILVAVWELENWF